jgi:hypothetical protein
MRYSRKIGAKTVGDYLTLNDLDQHPALAVT